MQQLIELTQFFKLHVTKLHVKNLKNENEPKRLFCSRKISAKYQLMYITIKVLQFRFYANFWHLIIVNFV